VLDIKTSVVLVSAQDLGRLEENRSCFRCQGRSKDCLSNGGQRNSRYESEDVCCCEFPLEQIGQSRTQNR